MADFVLGVGGHIDHGKTTLTHALTGVETDRLIEEKRRGLTIEPGYAPLTLPDGAIAALVDVPGHEKFIGNMLAGAAGIDALLLCVAADDGVMPQTIEHLELCTLLGVERVLVAVTKKDLLREENGCPRWEGIQRMLDERGISATAIVPVSARTGEGISALRDAIAALGRTLPPRAAAPFRMNVDRVFTREGFGTVVTGTVAAGAVTEGHEVMLYPGERRCRVRGLQRHGAAAGRAEAGQRAALNLAGIARGDIGRGSTAAAAESMTVTRVVEAQITLLPHAAFSVKTGSLLHLHAGSGSGVARCTLRGQPVLNPGESCAARLRLDGPMAVRVGDRFVLRFFSPVSTVGGGVVMAAEETGRRETRREQAPALLEKYHATYPLRDGMPLAEFVKRTGGQPEECPEAKRRGTAVALKAFRPKYTDALARERDKIEVCYRRFGLEPQSNGRIVPPPDGEVVDKLLRDGVLVALGADYRMHRRYVEQAETVLRELAEVTPSAYRQALGVSRRYAVLLLEYFEKQEKETPKGTDCPAAARDEG